LPGKILKITQLLDVWFLITKFQTFVIWKILEYRSPKQLRHSQLEGSRVFFFFVAIVSKTTWRLLQKRQPHFQCQLNESDQVTVIMVLISKFDFGLAFAIERITK